MGHWALGIGHWALAISYFSPASSAPLLPLPPLLPLLSTQHSPLSTHHSSLNQPHLLQTLAESLGFFGVMLLVQSDRIFKCCDASLDITYFELHYS